MKIFVNQLFLDSLVKMDSNQLVDAFKSQLKSAEEAKRRNQQAPRPRPFREPEQERFHWQMMSLQMDMSKTQRQQKTNFEVQTTMTSGI